MGIDEKDKDKEGEDAKSHGHVGLNCPGSV